MFLGVTGEIGVRFPLQNAAIVPAIGIRGGDASTPYSAPRSPVDVEGESDWYCGTSYDYNAGSEWVPLTKHSDVYAPHPRITTWSGFRTHTNEVGGLTMDHDGFGVDHISCNP